MSFKIAPFSFVGQVNVDQLVAYLREIYDRLSQSDLIKAQVLPLPAWDMDADATKTIKYDPKIKIGRFVGMNLSIENDARTERYFGSLMGDNIEVSKVDGTNVTITRKAGGFFDSTDFDDTSFSRGELVLWYTT